MDSARSGSYHTAKNLLWIRQDLGRAEVPNFTSKVEAALHTNFDKANRVIGLTLIPENNRVANRVFNTCGDTELEDASIRSAMDVSRISDFCLRLVCQPSSTSSGRRGVICKYTVLLFPASAPELANTAESQSARLPRAQDRQRPLPAGPRGDKVEMPNRPSHSPQYAIWREW